MCINALNVRISYHRKFSGTNVQAKAKQLNTPLSLNHTGNKRNFPTTKLH